MLFSWPSAVQERQAALRAEPEVCVKQRLGSCRGRRNLMLGATRKQKHKDQYERQQHGRHPLERRYTGRLRNTFQRLCGRPGRQVYRGSLFLTRYRTGHKTGISNGSMHAGVHAFMAASRGFK
jgi:hypothetical protein